MQSEENKKKRILEVAHKSFMTLGYSSVTMDDIARAAGMGKGTVYQLFPSKQELLLCSIDFFAARVDASIQKILSDESIPPIVKLREFFKTVIGQLSYVRPQALTEIERSLPEAFEKIEQTRQRIIGKELVGLLESGKKSGIYDPNMDAALVAHIVIGAVQHILQEKVLATLDYSFEQLFKSVLSVILKGCLTDESRKMVF